MAWSVALACASAGEPTEVFRPGLVPDAAAAIARGLYPADTLTETGDTVLDFALWPYEDELFVGAFERALLLCDRRLFCSTTTPAGSPTPPRPRCPACTAASSSCTT